MSNRIRLLASCSNTQALDLRLEVGHRLEADDHLEVGVRHGLEHAQRGVDAVGDVVPLAGRDAHRAAGRSAARSFRRRRGSLTHHRGSSSGASKLSENAPPGQAGVVERHVRRLTGVAGGVGGEGAEVVQRAAVDRFDQRPSGCAARCCRSCVPDPYPVLKPHRTAVVGRFVGGPRDRRPPGRAGWPTWWQRHRSPSAAWCRVRRRRPRARSDRRSTKK